jgi:hypothetical protein
MSSPAADARFSWLDVFAVLERWNGPEEILSRPSFEWIGKAALWDWADSQSSPLGGPGSWSIYANEQPADVVRDTLPLWVGVMGRHPTPAFFVQLVQDRTELAAFSSHGVREWRALLASGRREIPPTKLCLVPSDGDWLRFALSADRTWLAPIGGRVERAVAVPPPSTPTSPAKCTPVRARRRR